MNAPSALPSLLAALPGGPGIPRPDGPAALAALVREAAGIGAERHVLHLSAARLGPALQRAHHRQMLRGAMAPLLRLARSRLFELPNGDLVAVAPPPLHLLESCRLAVLGLLEGAADAEAVTLHVLPRGAAGVLALLETALLPPAAAGGPAPAPGTPLDAAGLAVLERVLGQASLDPFLRREAVCRIDPGEGGTVWCWEDRRVDLGLLGDQLRPGVDLAAAPWLLRRLRRLLDRRLLAGMARPAAVREQRAAGLRLLPASLTGAAFLKLDALLPRDLRGDLVLALDGADILAEPETFAFARDFARGRGYRLALDDATPALLALLPPARLGLDLVRLAWDPALLAPGAAERLRPLLPTDPGAVVLTGVDRPAAIAWGWEAGLRLFQGRLIEQRRGDA